jgi:hypothetical protein
MSTLIFNPSHQSYGAASDAPSGLQEGVYLVGDYLYSYYAISGDLFLLAEPGNDYSDNMKKIVDAPMREAVFAAITSNGRKVLKDEIRSNRERIAALPAAAPITKPEEVLNPPPPGSGAFYKQPWFWVAAVGGTALVGYAGWSFYKSRKATA